MRDGPANWPRIVIDCDGTAEHSHDPVVVRIYARNDAGSWLPMHTAIRRDGTEVFVGKTGDDADRGQFIWECTWHGCAYRNQFRHPVGRVAELMDPVLDRFVTAGGTVLEATLRGIEKALRETPYRIECP